MGGGGGGKVKQPNWSLLSQQQQQLNRASAIDSARLSMIGQNVPGGSLRYNQVGEVDGLPQFEANVELTPEAQAAFDTRLGLDKDWLSATRSGLNRVAPTIGTPLDFSGAPALVSTVGDDFGEDRKRIEDALMQRLDPTLKRDREFAEQQLVNRGVTPGSGVAWERGIDDVARAENDARLAVIGEAGSEQQRLFAMALANAQLQDQARQQYIAEILQKRQVPFNEVMQMYGESPDMFLPGFLNTPQFNIQAPDLLGAVQSGYGTATQGEAGAAATKSQRQSGMMAGGSAIVGAGLMAAAIL